MSDTAAPRSRVFRQVVTMEIVWTVDPGEEPPHTDWEAVCRAAVQDNPLGCGSSSPAFGCVSEVEELEARP